MPRHHRRYRPSTKKPLAPLLFVLAVVLLVVVVAFAIRPFVCYTAQVSICGVTLAQEVDEAATVTSAITSLHHFSENSALQPDETHLRHSRLSIGIQATTGGSWKMKTKSAGNLWTWTSLDAVIPVAGLRARSEQLPLLLLTSAFRVCCCAAGERLWRSSENSS